MGLDWRLSFKTEAGEYVDACDWGDAGSRYYGPHPDSKDGWCEVGDWPSIQTAILRCSQEHKSPLYYWSDEHEEPILVTPELLTEINKHFMKARKK